MPIIGQFPAVIQLSSLNGANGFELDGENAYDCSGFSVGSAGDVNQDGIQDIIIGAYNSTVGGLPTAGKTYVIFGKSIGWISPFSLGSLNGTNGFELDGVAADDRSGHSVSTAGDVNNDGVSDIIVGAVYASPGGLLRAGKTYVIFGKNTRWVSPISLSSLNGTNGFELDGVTYDDRSGHSVSTAGDINNDGIQDIIIGANLADPVGGLINAGKTYVLFGKRSGWASPISLGSLNGTNGFGIDGVTIGEQSGSSVSAAGDVNSDGIADIIIGAFNANLGGLNEVGKTYVIFGNSTGWSSSISLGSLNGGNGFEFDGEEILDRSGWSVSQAGDVNDDGIQDIIISACWAPAGTYAGKVYVVFGKSTGWTSPISLGSLNGTNGFELNAVTDYDQSGYSVSTAGDINNDGIQDIIIGSDRASPNGLTNAGKTYVVFGKSTGWSSPISLGSLNGINGFELDGVGAQDWSGASVSYARDVNNDGIQDIIIGAWGASPNGLTNAGKTYVIFGDSPPVLVNNYLNITQGQRFLFNSSFLSAYCLNHDNGTLVFTPSNVVAGQFEIISDPGIVLSNFTQQQIWNGSIQFMHDGSSLEPSYDIGVTTTGLAFVPPQAANITFSLTPAPTYFPTVMPSLVPSILPTISSTNPIPNLVQNSLTLNNGETLTLTAANLQAVESNFNNSQLLFTVSNVQQGNFYRMPANVTTYTFPQLYIEQGRIQFRHAGTNIAPAYSVIVSDGTQTTLPAPATINFQGAPNVQINPFNMTQSGTQVLGSQLVNITGSVAPNLITLQLANLQHVTFINTQTSLPVTSFTYADLQAGIIQFQQDGSPNAPSFTLTATVPPGVSSSPLTPIISFSAQGVFAPRLLNNYLIIAEGQTVTLAPLQMYALQGSNPVPDTATFYINNIQYGYFSLSTTPNVRVSFFSQAQLRQSLMRFTHDGSSNIPNYQASVASNGLQSASLTAGVFFSPLIKAPRLTQPFPDQMVTVGKPFSFAIVNNFVDPQGEAITLTTQEVNRTVLPQWLSYNPINLRFSGTAPDPGITDIEIIATNLDQLSSQSDFVINTVPDASTGLSYLNKTIISAAVSGGVGLSFYLFKLCLKRAADKKLLESLKQNADAFDTEVVRPIAEAISKRVKITGFAGISENTLEEFKSAVRTLITEIDVRGVDIRLQELEPHKRDALINEIATQTKLYLKEKRSCGRAFCSFFTAEASPEDIRKAAPDIAEQVASTIENRQNSSVIMRGIELEEEAADKPARRAIVAERYNEMVELQSMDLRMKQ